MKNQREHKAEPWSTPDGILYGIWGVKISPETLNPGVFDPAYATVPIHLSPHLPRFFSSSSLSRRLVIINKLKQPPLPRLNYHYHSNPEPIRKPSQRINVNTIGELDIQFASRCLLLGRFRAVLFCLVAVQFPTLSFMTHFHERFLFSGFFVWISLVAFVAACPWSGS
mgnify:CR=1 FL=1